MEFKKLGINVISSRTTPISSEVLRYFVDYFKAKNKGFNSLEPKKYLELILFTLIIFELLKEEINTLNLNDDEKNTIEVFKQYINRELTGEYIENYLKYLIWKKDEVVRYSIDEYKSYLEVENSGWVKIYAIPIPNIVHLEAIGNIFLKASKNLGIFG
ncbi:conserved hypothetical protein [Methanococcus vannielii SB]|uniref:Uncharacterized protein n=1 Tax=Methanococcus vannielii (strain ATCC 35089 / DSM 1224 / JCM 13029 / OCM 148 / SB) TaxID=406327 RepID=A6UNH8_METVS|nr:hypothetical protein [Methanococcus vannielii]ABR54050.1 conserved hypothetical protein [Methanococcus vannielii SB]